MNYRYTKLFIAAAVAAVLGGCSTSSDSGNSKKLVVSSMKCEFVPDGDTAYFYGQGLDAVQQVIFPTSNLNAEVLTAVSDSVLPVVVPKGAGSGKIGFVTLNDTVYTNFVFRDSRNIIVDFDSRLATWGGYDPYGDEGETIESVMSGDSVVKLPAKLLEGCSDSYGLLYGRYSRSWDMMQSLWIQYVGNPGEGGRGIKSVAGPFEGYPISQLAFKFEVYVPEAAPYKSIRAEIFFGPADAPDKHGRDRSPIYFWTPFQETGSFHTDGWQTVTIPLTAFTHGIHSDAEKFPTPVELNKAVNFTFVLFGDAEMANSPEILMGVDNFRIVPIED